MQRVLYDGLVATSWKTRFFVTVGPLSIPWLFKAYYILAYYAIPGPFDACRLSAERDARGKTTRIRDQKKIWLIKERGVGK